MKWLILAALLVSPSIAFAQTPDEASEAELEKSLLAATDEIANKVAEVRGLSVKAKVKRGIKKRDELRRTLVQKLAEDVSDDDIAGEGKLMKRLGLIPKDLDYKKVLLDVLTEQIAGFYDQGSKELYIMVGIPLSLQRPAMAHEIFHALQDQHFDILSLQEPFTTTEYGDFMLARSALLEGDATVLMFDFSLQEAGTIPKGQSVADQPMLAGIIGNLSFDQLTALEQMMGAQNVAGFGATSLGDSAMARAPRVFRESLMFPYFAGMRFIVLAKQGRTWEEVNKIYANPPVSTEQILHPEKYFDSDMPVFLDFDVSKSLPGYKPIFDTVFGEFQTSLFLRHHLGSEADVIEATTGWDGDRALGYEKDGEIVFVSLSVWDSDKDAVEYFDGVKRTFDKRYETQQTINADGKYGKSLCLTGTFDGAQERHYIERWGDLVLHVEGANSKIVDGKETDPMMAHIRRDVFKSLKRIPFVEYEQMKIKEKAAAKTPKGK